MTLRRRILSVVGAIPATRAALLDADERGLDASGRGES